MKKLVASWQLLIAIAAIAASCSAQEITFQQPVFTNQTSNAYSAAVKNFNQAAHWLFFCNTGVASGYVQLLGSYDSNPAHGVVISPKGFFSGNQCGLIQAGGYYFAVFAQVQQLTGPMSVSAWYSGSTGPLANVFPQQLQGSGTATYSLIQCDNEFTVSVASNTETQLVASTLFSGIEVCNAYISGVGGTSVTDALYASTGSGCVFRAGAVQLDFVIPATNYFFLPFGGNIGAVFQYGALGVGAPALCYHHGSSGAPVQVTIAYAKN